MLMFCQFGIVQLWYVISFCACMYLYGLCKVIIIHLWSEHACDLCDWCKVKKARDSHVIVSLTEMC